jgi:flagellar basal-body rod protein FlgG
MYQALVEPGAPTSSTTQNPAGIQVGLGVKLASVTKDFSQGDLTATSNPLDVAIEGDGFFQITRPDGSIAYTRSGGLQIDSQGSLVTPDGYAVAPGITIPQDAQSISIAQDGTVSVRQPGSTTPSQIGQITAVRFPNNGGLKALGKNLFEETDSSGAPLTGIFGQNGYGNLSQGFLESSNVSVVEQVVNMITAQRAYEASSKGIQSADEMLGQAISLKR